MPDMPRFVTVRSSFSDDIIESQPRAIDFADSNAGLRSMVLACVPGGETVLTARTAIEGRMAAAEAINGC